MYKIILHYTNGKEKTCRTQYELLRYFRLGIVTNSDTTGIKGDISDVDIITSAIINGFVCKYTKSKEDQDVHCYQI